MADELIPENQEAVETPVEEVTPKKAVAKKPSVKKAAPKAAQVKPATKGPKREISPTQRRRGKRYAEQASKIDPDQTYEISDAIQLARETATVKFDPSLELHIRLGLDTRHQDQQLRGTVVLPAGTGKSKRVAVIASLDKQKEARDAGADLVGEDDLIKRIEDGSAEFDVVVATPDVMGKVGRLGKVLGTKGLMPNPKSGTVTPDVGRAVQAIKGGQVEFRADKAGIVHAAFGRASFAEADLEQNLKTLLDALMRGKPTGAKGTYVRSMYVTSTMGPSIRLDQKVLSHLHD
jgi:large subunit ribosomal protein L1